MENLPEFVSFGEALTDFVRQRGHSWQSVAGGSCWNVARSVAGLGLASAWGGTVSRDPFGDEIMALSRAAGLDERYAWQVDQPPLLAMVHDTNPPVYRFQGVGTADLAFDPGRLPEGWASVCRIAHFGCISLVRPPLGARLVELAEDLSTHGVHVSFDANVRNLMDDDYPPRFEHMVTLADLVKVSDEDLSAVYPERSTESALVRITELAPNALVVYTRGASGLTGRVGGQSFEQPALTPPGEGDSVGAGDACVGGLIASLFSESDNGASTDILRHLRFAAATAAVACSRVGAYAPTREEVDLLLTA